MDDVWYDIVDLLDVRAKIRLSMTCWKFNILLSRRMSAFWKSMARNYKFQADDLGALPKGVDRLVCNSCNNFVGFKMRPRRELKYINGRRTLPRSCFDGVNPVSRRHYFADLIKCEECGRPTCPTCFVLDCVHNKFCQQCLYNHYPTCTDMVCVGEGRCDCFQNLPVGALQDQGICGACQPNKH